MKYLIIISLFITACCPNKPSQDIDAPYKYHLGEKVKVLNGFYQNCTGRIDNVMRYNEDSYILLDIYCNYYSAYTEKTFKEKDLEKINE